MHAIAQAHVIVPLPLRSRQFFVHAGPVESTSIGSRCV
jgi:hypothetical protein